MDWALVSSAHAHNLQMAKYDEMSHQLPGEAYFATRILHAGFNYQYAGENIAWNSIQTQAGAESLETMMYDETPPNDDHRKNILSVHYTKVGIDIYFDAAHGRMWMTQDFGSLR